MPNRIDTAAFLDGRDAYTSKTPLLEIAGRVEALAPDAAESFMFGVIDGVIADLRDCAQNAREEMAERAPSRTIKD